MAEPDIEQTMHTPPATFCYRFPKRDRAELVISMNGKVLVLPVTLSQLKLAAYQTVKAVAEWPEAKK